MVASSFEPLDDPDDPPAWHCLSCQVPLHDDPPPGGPRGISLSDSQELHVCEDCWTELSIAERLEACRRWRLQGPLIDALQEARDICRGARDGFHLPGLGEAGRN